MTLEVAITPNEVKLFQYMKHLSQTSTNSQYLGRVFENLIHFVNNVEKLNKKSYFDYLKDHAAVLATEKTSGETIRSTITNFLGWCGVKFFAKAVKPKRLSKTEELPEDIREKLNRFVIWLKDHYDYSDHTISNYCLSVRMFFCYCKEFNQENVRAFANTMYEEGKAPRTVNLRMTALMNYGESIGKPVYMKRPKIQMVLNMENVPSEKEVNTLTEYLKKCRKIILYFCVRIMATSGCRISELFQMKWSDIANEVVTLKCKGNKFRRIFFPKALAKEVKDFLKESGTDGESLIALNKYGALYKDNGLRIALKEYAEKCGVPREKVHPHAFRHYFAKQYLKKRPGDIVGLAELLGHSKLDTTRIYLLKTYDEQKRNYNKTVTW